MKKFAFDLVSKKTALFNSVNSGLFVLAPSIIDIPDNDVGLYKGLHFLDTSEKQVIFTAKDNLVLKIMQ